MRGSGIRVLIVGAGVAGLAAARRLREWGADVELVDRTSGPTTEGSGIYLPGNAIRALHDLDLGEKVVRNGIRIERQRFSDHRGRVLVDIEAADTWRNVGDCVAVHRATLHGVLLAGAGDVPIRWGLVPRSIMADRDGVSITLSDNATDEYDLVIGADGVHSAVRRLVFPSAAIRPVGQYARRFIVRGLNFPPVWSVQLGPGSSFLTIPIDGDQVYCYCDGPPSDRRPLSQILSGYAEPVPTLLEMLASADGGHTGAVQEGAIEEVALDRWSHGGVLLIGDAAHATSPNMAQGAAMALEDALVLSECLGAADGIAGALTAFERRRRARTDWVRSQTHRRDRTRALPAPVRNFLVRRLGRRIYRANYEPLLAPA